MRLKATCSHRVILPSVCVCMRLQACTHAWRRMWDGMGGGNSREWFWVLKPGVLSVLRTTFQKIDDKLVPKHAVDEVKLSAQLHCLSSWIQLYCIQGHISSPHTPGNFCSKPRCKPMTSHKPGLRFKQAVHLQDIFSETEKMRDRESEREKDKEVHNAFVACLHR